MNDILHGLNDQQKAAVTCPSNVLQVLAPPGSGKTKTLTARVAYHIAHERFVAISTAQHYESVLL
jgi:DNA helicase-2/ATP-dependent DNA helicase PcrA